MAVELDCTDAFIAATHAVECAQQSVATTAAPGSSDAVQQLANQVLEGYAKVVATTGTMWVSGPTSVLDAGSGGVVDTAPPVDVQVSQILGYVTYIGLTVAILSLIGLGAMLAIRFRRGDGVRNVGAFAIVLVGVLLISGSSAIVGGILGNTAPGGSTSTVGFLQNSLWYVVGALAVVSVILAGIRMAWEQRADPGKNLLRSLVTLIVVSGSGLAIVGLLVTAADAFSVWVLDGATECHVSDIADASCFGTDLYNLLAIGGTVDPTIGVIGTLVLAGLAMLMSYVQIALMVARGGLIVILAGVLPLTASFTNTAMGRQWFGKTVGWLLAFILYKPAAALVYAAAFQLFTTDAFSGGQDAANPNLLWGILTGMSLMLMAIVALPALLRFAAPLTGVVGSGAAASLSGFESSGGGVTTAASGAVQLGHSISRQSIGSTSGGGAATGSSRVGVTTAVPTMSRASTTGAVGSGAPVVSQLAAYDTAGMPEVAVDASPQPAASTTAGSTTPGSTVPNKKTDER